MTAHRPLLALLAGLLAGGPGPVAAWASPAAAQASQDSIRGTLRYKVRGLSAVQGGFLSGSVMSLATATGLQAATRNMLRLLTGAAKLSNDPGMKEMETFLRTGKGFDFSGAPVSAGYDVVLDFLLVRDEAGTYRLRAGTARYSGNTDSDVELRGDKGNVHRFTDRFRGEGTVALTPEHGTIALTVTGRGADRRGELDVNVSFPVTVVGKTTWVAMGGVATMSVEDRGDVTVSRMSAFGSTHTDTKPAGGRPYRGVAYHRRGPLDSVLSGRETWQDLADSGVLVEWSLGGRPEGDLTVAIQGPACACLEGEKVPGARVTWTAEASERGGSFGPFTVRAGGTAPTVVENAGGRVVLAPARTTGAITLEATYTRGGKKATATKVVSVCIIDSIRVADGERDFAFDDARPGVLFVPNARTRATHDGRDASAELAWRFDPIGPPGETTMKPASPRGGNVTVTYTGLPALNGAFGRKQMEATLEAGTCLCRRTGEFRAFYSPTATNHPSAGADALGEQPVPNWFYYMVQTSATRGITRLAFARHRTSSDGVPAIGQFDEQTGVVSLTARLWQVGCAPAVPRGRQPVPLGSVRGGSTGIDCVAETARHEDQHRRDDASWWPRGYLALSDLDLDRVPGSVEERHPGCSDASAKSCEERPFLEVSDRELNAYWTGWAWPKGSANGEDWACGPLGKQWGAGVNCAE